MERIPSKLFRLFAMLLHIYFLIMIIQIWGLKLKTFLFLTKINFFLNCYLFTYLFFNSIMKFETREHYFEENIRKESYRKFYLYTKKEMTLIKISFALSVTVNFLYWMIIYFKRDFMGDTETPAHVEYFLHGGNSVIILLECFFNKKSLHNKIDLNAKQVLVFGFIYITIKYIVYLTMDVQIYPMISKLPVYVYYCLNIVGYMLYLLSCLIFKILFI